MIQLLGSGSTLRACAEINRNAYGFEIKKDFYKKAKELMLNEEIINNLKDKEQLSFFIQGENL